MYKYFARPLLFRLSADKAHETILFISEKVSQKKWLMQSASKIYSYKTPSLSQKIWGLTFPNPLGLAAGFDKNGTAAPLMEKLGFGFVEIGSVTANPSTGNPKPRSFRLPLDKSLINRLGLNNDGAQTISRRIKKLNLGIPMGVNIAKTHNPDILGDAAIEDYKTSFILVKDIADYITINISCPNTTEGKTFEEPDILSKLLAALELDKDSSLPPVLIKFSVDLDAQKLTELLSVCEKAAVSGYVATNTSSERSGLVTPEQTLQAIGHGGLSGKAISKRSTEIIEKIHDFTNGEKTIIGVGGISSGEDAIDKLKAGADLLQVYTALVYQGPGLVKQINRHIANYLHSKGLDHIYQLRSAKDSPGKS